VTEAGAKVLRSGGSAIESAIAVGATIGVVYPHFCGVGGEAVWLVADREGRRAAFLGIGQAAQALLTFDRPIPTRGPLSILTTACAVGS
jgi:gamma-glutamyltranspeptidase/glutathione hydrolase